MDRPVAVVMGAGSGLGAALAHVFAGEGMAIAVLDIDPTTAQAAADQLVAEGTPALAVVVDVADRESVAGAAKRVSDEFGRCDMLCANVGVQQFGALDQLTPEDWDWVLSVNVLGVVNTVNAFLPLLRANPDAARHIVVTSSSSVLVPAIRIGAYITSKYAITGYAEVLRLELAPEGIGVTTMFPAGMMTRHLESSMLARPEALGPSVLRNEDIEAMLAAAVEGDESLVMATPEHAVRNLVAAVQAGDPYVITHGQYAAQVEARVARLLDAFARCAENP